MPKKEKDKVHIERHISRLHEQSKAVQHHIREKIAGAIVAAFAFVMAFVWRDAIRETAGTVIKRMGLEGSSYISTIISAIITSIICVFGILYFSKWSEKK